MQADLTWSLLLLTRIRYDMYNCPQLKDNYDK